jgi:hypothetical protein
MAQSSNYKNELQIYFQQAGQPLPQYQLISDQPCGQNGHLFTSKVILADGRAFQGKGNTKRGSEMEASREACQYYLIIQNIQRQELTSSANSGQVYQKPVNPQFIFLIDIENMPKAIDYHFPEGSHVLGFASNLSPQYKNCENFNKNQRYCDFRVIDSAVRDAADIALIFECGILTQTYPNLPFFIVSSDHYAQPLLKLLQSHHQEQHQKITCLRDLQAVLDSLKA